MPILGGPSHPSKSGGKPDSLVVMLHGLGSNGDDLISLADMWADVLPNTAFHAPNAPHPFDYASSGFQWYSRQTEESRRDGVRAVTDTVTDYVDELLDQYGLEPTRCVQVGFSQGSIVSLHVVPRRQRPLAGLVAFSGFMATADTLHDEIANKTPITLIHGEEDATLPSSHSEDAGQVLTKLEVPNEVHILPGLGHSIDMRGIELSTRFMTNIFGAST
jgi:phospholipase/carboxylesterase